MIEEYKKKPDENERQYIWRMGQYVINGTFQNWKELTPILNMELREDESEYRDESAYRKPWQEASKYYEDVFSKMIGDEYHKEILKQQDELYKIKRQVWDQRREYNKLLVSDARADHLSEQLIEIAQQLNKEKPLNFNEYVVDVSDKEGLLVLADWHYGMLTDNIWNTYNIEICKQRIKIMVAKVKQHIKTNKINTLHIMLLGDMAHGAIHTSARVASEENTNNQLMQVSEIIAEVIGELSKEVNEVKVYSTYGNHMRTIQDKNDSVHSDNMETLIPWWLKQRLQNNNKVSIIDGEFYEFLKLNILGYNIVATHGDLDNIKNLGITINTVFNKIYNESIDYTISADKHHLEEFERFDIENILVRSLCGTDDYANGKRLYSSAGQTFMVFNKEDGRECTYNIKLR